MKTASTVIAFSRRLSDFYRIVKTSRRYLYRKFYTPRNFIATGNQAMCSIWRHFKVFLIRFVIHVSHINLLRFHFHTFQYFNKSIISFKMLYRRRAELEITSLAYLIKRDAIFPRQRIPARKDRSRDPLAALNHIYVATFIGVTGLWKFDVAFIGRRSRTVSADVKGGTCFAPERNCAFDLALSSMHRRIFFGR